MLRQQQWVRPLLVRAVAGDAVCAFLVLWGFAASLGVSVLRGLVTGVVAAVAWCGLVLVSRGYEWRRIGDGPEEFQTLIRCAIFLVAVLGVFDYATRGELPRRYVLAAVPFMAVLTGFHRYLLRRHLRRLRDVGDGLLRTLLVGDTRAVRSCARDLVASRYHGYQVVGACLASLDDPTALDGLPRWGVVSDVPQVVVERDVDVVVVVGAQLSGESLRRLSWALERTGADLVVAPGLIEVTGPQVTHRPTAGLSLLHVDAPARRVGVPLLKAVFDRTLGALGLVVALPVVLVAMLVIRATSPGPAIYRQQRVGRDGQLFTLFKLRTMRMDADFRRAELLEDSDRDGLMFKMRKDPRITPVGRWLRRFSLDELPQLWNVLRGDMALVGPRPPLPEEYARYHDAVHRRLRVKPGLTGLWQVSGRSDLGWDESVRLDLRYVDNWSIPLDLQILWKTARAVLRGSGAY